MNPVRLGTTLVIIGAILIIATTGTFLLFFHAQNFSPNITDWGAFGSYLGGVMGASISTLALIGAVIVIYQNHKAEQRASNQAIASDLMKSIERLEDGIDSSLKTLTIRAHYPELNMHIDTEAFSVLTRIYPPKVSDSAIPRYSDDNGVLARSIIGENLPQQEILQRINLLEIFSMATGKLRLMRNLLAQHRRLSGHNAAAIYYKRKYKSAVNRLIGAGYPLETWDDIDEA